MNVVTVQDGSHVTLELSFEDTRRLALMCNVATQEARGNGASMQIAGLPSGGSTEAQPFSDSFSVYHSFFEALALAMLCKSYMTPEDRFDVPILRQPAEPTWEELNDEPPAADTHTGGAA